MRFIINANMSTSTKVTRSKGESDGLSLPTRTRPTRKETKNTSYNVGWDQQQQMPTQMPQLPTQSPQANSVRRTETPASMLPPAPHRPLTPCLPLPTLPATSSRSSTPLFKEDTYSSTSEEETEADAEITFIHGRNQPNGMFVTDRPTPIPMKADYTTQGDPEASPSTSNLFKSTATGDKFLGTNNFFIPDGSDRRIHQIDNKVFHADYLENGNNAYFLELPALEKMLNTRKFLMDEMSGQCPTICHGRCPADVLTLASFYICEVVDHYHLMRNNSRNQGVFKPILIPNQFRFQFQRCL